MPNRFRHCALAAALWTVFAVSVACGGSPSTPSPTAAPTPGSVLLPPRPSAAFEISGLVTTDDGAGVPGATVTLLLDAMGYSGPSVLTDATGRYATRFNAAPGQIHHPGLDAAGTEQAVTFATVEAPGYERFARLVLGTTEHLVENVRLHRIERITAGESVRLTIAPDDTSCVIDAWPGREFICGIVRVVVPSSGTMSVEAIPIQGGSRPPRLVVYGGNTGRRGNPSIVQVLAGTEYHINVEVPWGSNASQSFIVNTSMAVE